MMLAAATSSLIVNVILGVSVVALYMHAILSGRVARKTSSQSLVE
jgi:hypothetical protein